MANKKELWKALREARTETKKYAALAYSSYFLLMRAITAGELDVDPSFTCYQVEDFAQRLDLEQLERLLDQQMGELSHVHGVPMPRVPKLLEKQPIEFTPEHLQALRDLGLIDNSDD